MTCLAVIGVGNMAKAILAGIAKSDMDIHRIVVLDKNPEQYRDLPQSADGNRFTYEYALDTAQAVANADVVLLSVKPQNYPELLAELAAIPNADQKLYISIGAGITVAQISNALHGAHTVRVLPNVPMLIGMGVSVICRNDAVSPEHFEMVCDIFRAAGNIILIDESEMNRIIGVTSSSPAYVFRFIRAMYEGALAQGLQDDGALLAAICDTVIGSATMLKQAAESPDALIAKVASKGGTTEQALLALDRGSFDQTVLDAMLCCTARADELGNASKQ